MVTFHGFVRFSRQSGMMLANLGPTNYAAIKQPFVVTSWPGHLFQNTPIKTVKCSLKRWAIY